MIKYLKMYCFQYEMDKEIQVKKENFHSEASHCFSQNTTRMTKKPCFMSYIQKLFLLPLPKSDITEGSNCTQTKQAHED